MELKANARKLRMLSAGTQLRELSNYWGQGSRLVSLVTYLGNALGDGGETA